MSDYQLPNMRSYLKGQSFNYSELIPDGPVTSSPIVDNGPGPSVTSEEYQDSKETYQ